MTVNTMTRARAWAGPAILSYGFRPFFLLGALWAAGAMAVWLAHLPGQIGLAGPFAPTDWHAHALLFGYASAAIAGFGLTAVPNWTGRLPIVGWPLAGRTGFQLPEFA
ncbi:NnrS family protein [Paracoccus bogoriensis]|uniref:NnrS family protein n=1 Tax=Paracoccus bogoriensis TaxID=242065 RepID=UPI001CA520F3|nr:NnrS family protein [Paracoccus bogoriensis]